MENGGWKAIGSSLWDATRAVTREFDSRLAAFGANRAIWFIYLALDRGSHLTQRELATTVGVSAATLTHHLNKLEARGLVRRDPDPGDRRVYRISLTTSGRSAFEEIRRAASAYDRELRDALGPEASAELQSALEVLVRTATPSTRDP